jgi:hypothetical protein
MQPSLTRCPLRGRNCCRPRNAGHKSSSDTHHDEEPVVRSSAYFYRLVLAICPGGSARTCDRTHPKPDQHRYRQCRARVPNGGLLVVPDAMIIAHRDPFIAPAARYRLPAVYPWRYFVTAGALMSYGIEQHRRAAEGGLLCRWHPARRKARRSAGVGADQIRTGDQPQNRKGARSDYAARTARYRRRGDRMSGAMSPIGTFRKCRDSLTMSAHRGIQLQSRKIERGRKSRKSRCLDVSTDAMLARADTKVRGRFCVKRCGPSHRRVRNA